MAEAKRHYPFFVEHAIQNFHLRLSPFRRAIGRQLNLFFAKCRAAITDGGRLAQNSDSDRSNESHARTSFSKLIASGIESKIVNAMSYRI